jgi:acyl carrier protein
MDAKSTLRSYLAEEIGDANGLSEVRDDDSLFQLGILDSIQILKLTTFLEETFGIEVGDGELVPENFETLSALSRYVESKRPSQS